MLQLLLRGPVDITGGGAMIMSAHTPHKAKLVPLGHGKMVLLGGNWF